MSSSTEVLRSPEVPDLLGARMPELRGVESTHDAARAQGYAVGWAQGRREAAASARYATEELARTTAQREAERDAEVAAAVDALSEAARLLHDTLLDTCRRVDEQAGALALELTGALVGAAVPSVDHVLDRVLGLLPEHPVASVRLHPDVAAAAGDLADHGISVVADASLARGDAVAHADDHVVDLRVEEALVRLAEVLG